MKIETQIIKNRSVILSGGTYEDRVRLIKEFKSVFLKELRGDVFILREGMRDAQKFLKSARNEFPIVPPVKGISKSQMSYSELEDYHLEWISQFKNVLVVIPEIYKLYENDPDYFFELLGFYLSKQHTFSGKNRFRFLMTSGERIAKEFDRIPVLIGGARKLSEKDLEFIEL